MSYRTTASEDIVEGEHIPSGWCSLPFSETIINQRIQVGKLNQSAYQRFGKYPVIDQGQSFVAGYTDDEDLIYQGELPVILFGDHTRIFKFVDFPFVCGADGVKILQPDTEKYDSRFHYYTCLHLEIPSRGYSRHYKLLQEQSIPLPPLPEQRRIAAVLNAIQDAIAAQEDVIAAARHFKRSLMQRLFTYGPGRDPAPTKETEIGEVPAHWEVMHFRDVVTVISGQVDPRLDPYRSLPHIGPENIEELYLWVVRPVSAPFCALLGYFRPDCLS